MEATGARGDPQLAVGRVAVDDHLAAVLARDLEDAVDEAPVDVGVARRERTVERGADRGERRVRGGEEAGVGAHRAESGDTIAGDVTRSPPRPARRAPPR